MERGAEAAIEAKRPNGPIVPPLTRIKDGILTVTYSIYWRERGCGLPRACTRQAFLRGQFSARAAAEPVLSVSDRCLSRTGTVCRVCEEFCDLEAIRFRLLGRGRSEPVIDHERCTLCRACLPACPVGAMSIAGGEP